MAHHIFCIMGKSGSGKDSIYRVLIQDESLGLNTVVTYTTRPRREKEQDGREYHFCTDEAYADHLAKGRIIEERAYDTCYGIWRYFTLDDGQIDPGAGDYLIIGTPESFASFCRYYGRDRVVPLYIEVEDGVRLSRALVREKKQAKPAYDEMCRRFLADRDDFSEDKLRAAGINRRFDNSTDVRETCINEIKSYIREFTD
ncbi:MAG: guanylate kinase [Lachnospiraceae bacterium]|nr:guanylate kinase [Lachnospiraceae bacterium]